MALPVPFLHQQDGGKYLETFEMHAVKTPDGKWVNWSITRGMVYDERRLVGPIIPKQDIGTIWQMWKDGGEDMPWALCFGVPPAAIMVSGMPIPKWTNETDFIGALAGSPVDVVRCETNDIWVPANCEIVFEGTISTSETAAEGPMTEYHGLVFPGASRHFPLFNVNAITHRSNPIIPICVAGRASEENHTVWGIMIAAELLDVCQKAGLPIRMVWCPFEFHCLWYVMQANQKKLLSLKTNAADFCRNLGHLVFSSKPGWYTSRILLVGDDIDPTNLEDVIWAQATRCEPGTQEYVFVSYSSIPLMPYISHGAKKAPYTTKGDGTEQKGEPGKSVNCCMFAAEFIDEQFPWQEALSVVRTPRRFKRRPQITGRLMVSNQSAKPANDACIRSKKH